MSHPQMNTTETIQGEPPAQERVVLFPTFGHLSVDGREWHVGVSGVVFAPGPHNFRRRMVMRVLQRLMRLSADELQTDLFRQRVNAFLVSAERGKQIAIQLGPHVHWLQRPSKRNGHFRGSMRLACDEARHLVRGGPGGSDWLEFRVARPPDGAETAVGSARLIGPTGLSVISDIDDTIKHSDVADRRQLLRNTFLHEFAPVPGMAAAYGRWAEQGAVFHYVSSSPWQLYGALQGLLSTSGFPGGSFHLRYMRLRDPSILRLFIARRATKRRAIRSIIRMFPHRRFVLVGDSGEKDPEIYGSIARMFPRQVHQIHIRSVPGGTTSAARLARAFRDLDPSRWQIFNDTSQLPHRLESGS